ncbi:MAG: hypothetical protein ACR2GD_08565 [Pyrinomonadaceae bacterium]
MNAQLKILQNKLKNFSSVREGITEVKEARETDKKLQDLSDFINESRS